ncbi:MAG: ATP-binding cassette domain-containing protein, partial [Pseudomonadota bacterium]
LIDAELIDADSDSRSLPGATMRASVISYTEDGLYFSLEGASFNLSLDQHIAAVGLGNSGKDELAQLLTRLINPTSGTISLGGESFSELPEALVGRRIAYAGPSTYLFTGSVRDNLLYPLKNRPVGRLIEGDDKEREAVRRQAELSGNSVDDISDEWVNLDAIGVIDDADLRDRVHNTLKLVELSDEVYQFGLLSRVDQSNNVELAGKIMQARKKLRGRLLDSQYARLVEPFDHEKYNTNLSVGENLLFGTIYDDNIDAERLAEHPYIRQVLDSTGLTNDFLTAGQKIAEIMLDLFADVEPGSELFEQFSFISGDDLPEFQQVLQRTRDLQPREIETADKALLLSLPFKLVVTRHRLGLITESIQERILDARNQIQDDAENRSLGIEFFDEAQYNPRISIQDNILFGKLVYGQANAQSRINELISEVVDELGLRGEIVEAGLAYEVGVGGARLSSAQRQKLGVARCLLKNPDLLVVNEALSGLDTAAERRIIERICAQMSGQGIFWVLARVKLAELFGNVMVIERGKLTAEGAYADLAESSEQLRGLLEQE